MRALPPWARRLSQAAVVGLAALLPASALAQEFPTKSVTFVVPFGPGGTADLWGRYAADRLSKMWGQSVIIENRPGAGSSVGTAHVAKAKPDGYTVLVVSGSFGTNPATLTTLPYDPAKDLTPVVMIGKTDLFLLTGSRIPMDTVQAIQEAAKTQLLFGATPGVGSIGHLGILQMNEALGIKSEFIHMNSGATALTELKGGRADLGVGVLFEARTGNGKPVVVMAEQRNPGFPDVPTSAEAGFPNIHAANWIGAFVPAGTPKEIVDKINRDVVSIMNSPESASFNEAQALQTSTANPEEFGAFVKGELDKWRGVAERAGLRK